MHRTPNSCIDGCTSTLGISRSANFKQKQMLRCIVIIGISDVIANVTMPKCSGTEENRSVMMFWSPTRRLYSILPIAFLGLVLCFLFLDPPHVEDSGVASDNKETGHSEGDALLKMVREERKHTAREFRSKE